MNAMKTKTLRILRIIWKILKFLFTAGETFIQEEATNENVVDNESKVLTLKKKKGDDK